MITEERHIIIFDGVCNLCNSAMRFIYKRDRKKIFSYFSLQSTEAKQLLNHYSNIPESSDTVYYLRDKKLLVKSSAVLYIFKDIGRAYSMLFIFMLMPKFVRNFIYDRIAKNRYSIFGKTNYCSI